MSLSQGSESHRAPEWDQQPMLELALTAYPLRCGESVRLQSNIPCPDEPVGTPAHAE
jgi:hypothetical protein